jgi:hypothetical protein
MHSSKGVNMGRKSREHRERRQRKSEIGQSADRAAQLEEELKQLMDGDAIFRHSPSCPTDIRESNLEDILAFEDVDSGTSLFDGLQAQGLELPHPDTLDEKQSAKKAAEVIRALSKLQILLIGYEEMSPGQFYSTLWHQTLWEGCYVKKRNPGAITIIDVSHSMPRSEIIAIMDEMMKTGTVH